MRVENPRFGKCAECPYTGEDWIIKPVFYGKGYCDQCPTDPESYSAACALAEAAEKGAE